MNSIVAAGLIVGFFTMLFVTPCKYAQGIYKMEYGELTRGEKLSCLIPIYNVAKAESFFTGHASFVGISSVFLLLMTIVRVLLVFLAPSVYIAHVISVILFLVAILLYYISNVYAVLTVLNTAQVGSFMERLLRSVFFPLGQYYIGTHLATVLTNLSREEEDE